MRREKKVIESLCSFIYYHQKAHFIIFNMWVIDISFFSMRDILHLKGDYNIKSTISLVLAYIVLILIITDLIHIYQTSELLKQMDLPFHVSNIEKKKAQIESNEVKGQDEKSEIDKEAPVTSEKLVMEIDEATTLYALDIDKSTFEFILTDLKEGNELNFSILLIRQNTLIFSVKMVLFNIILLTNQKLPFLQISLMICIELLYSLMNIFRYSQFKHYRSKINFLAKILQSLCCASFVIICLIMAI